MTPATKVLVRSAYAWAAEPRAAALGFRFGASDPVIARAIFCSHSPAGLWNSAAAVADRGVTEVHRILKDQALACREDGDPELAEQLLSWLPVFKPQPMSIIPPELLRVVPGCAEKELLFAPFPQPCPENATDWVPLRSPQILPKWFGSYPSCLEHFFTPPTILRCQSLYGEV